MKTIRIYNEDLEYTFTYDLNKEYKLYHNNKLCHEIFQFEYIIENYLKLKTK